MKGYMYTIAYLSERGVDAKAIRLLHPVLVTALRDAATTEISAIESDLFGLLNAAAKNHNLNECSKLISRLTKLRVSKKEIEEEDWPERADDICNMLLDAGDLASAYDDLLQAGERLDVNLIDLVLKVYDDADLLPEE